MEAFIASFCLVGLKAFQQQNVTHALYVPAFLVSFLIAASEIGVILAGVKLGWMAVPYLGLGGGFGVVIAMALHKRVFRQ